jgi:hypothetical protein
MTRQQVVGATLLLACAFPYLQIFPMAGESYTQPFPLFVGAASYLLIPAQMDRVPAADRLAMWSLAALGALLFVLTAAPYTRGQEYKYLLSYVSPLVLTVGLVSFLHEYASVARRLLAGAIAVWIGLAFVQTAYRPDFGTFLLGAWGASAVDIVQSGRGVLALAPEPTHHAFHILLLAAGLTLLDVSGRWTPLAALAVLDALVLAGSSSAALTLLLGAAVLFVWRRPFSGLIAGALGWWLWPRVPGVLAAILGDESRFYLLVADFIKDPGAALVADYSANIRLGGVYAIFVDIWQHHFWPRGLAWATWTATRLSALRAHDWIADLSLVGPASGIGILLFQAGALAIAPLGLMFRRVLQLRGRTLFVQVLLISALIVFVGQYYLSAPGFSLLYACAIHRAMVAAPPAVIMAPADDLSAPSAAAPGPELRT